MPRWRMRARVFEQAGDHAPLAVAEIGFAVALKNLLDGGARGGLDFAIRIDEGQMEAIGETASDVALARAHQPD